MARKKELFTSIQIYFKYLNLDVPRTTVRDVYAIAVSNGTDNDEVTRVWLDCNGNNFSPNNDSFRTVYGKGRPTNGFRDSP